MNFGQKWRKWIHGCLSSAMVSVLINGSSSKEFCMGKGLRQGDPLAPFLFIIAAEACNIAMKEAREIGIFHGVRLPKDGPLISRLQYADDALFLKVWSRSNMANLIRILRCFHLSSGLKVNLNKSQLLGIGVDGTEVEVVARNFHCKSGTFPIKYLGLPLGCLMNKGENWAPIINKFTARLSNWKSTSLSYGGRLTLAKSVLDGSKKIAWTSWNLVCSDKTKGGLGVGSPKVMNLAFLTKWWWRFKTENNSLWKKTIQSLHGDYGGLNKATPSGSFPGIWNNILKIDKDFEKDPKRDLVWWGFYISIAQGNLSILDWADSLNLIGEKGKAFKEVISTFIWRLLFSGLSNDRAYKASSTNGLNGVILPSLVYLRDLLLVLLGLGVGVVSLVCL
ncbi:hypothetical protein OSB04_022987 [Centaurea solstitialis]|uniref:Reverse transcriptase domain-containing protein n=1 Tax=Centaurea solstitialis TaxID=347529 RepID=A0AA38SVQ5_9ASTR|nr:hypothetical protein OSB04_022987 [Centaurea solstitialis]